MIKKLIEEFTTEVQVKIRQTGLDNFKMFSIFLILLIALFAFVLIGLEALSIAGGFAAVTTRSLFAIIGGFLQQQDIHKLHPDDGLKGASSDKAFKIDVSDPLEVAQVLDKILEIHRIN